MQVAAYTRLSEVKKTGEATDDALERQEERSRALAKAKGWTVAKVYSDVDIGAYRAAGKRKPPARPGFEQLLADIEAGAIKGVVFLKLERLTRDPGDFERLLAICEAHDAVLASVSEPIDTTTPMGESIARMLINHARLESQNTALRVAWQREQAARAGLPRLGANRPYGYADDRMTIIPEEKDFILQAVEGLLDGKSLRAVTRELNAAGSVGVRGGPWTTVKLRRTLMAPHLTGLRSYQGEVVAEGKWEKIIEREPWKDVCALLSDPARRKGGRPRRWLLVGGLARCGYPNCSAPLIVRHDGRGHACYVCESGQARPGWRGCGRISIRAEPFEELVTEMLLARDWRHLDPGSARTVDDAGLAAQLDRDGRKLAELAQRYAADEIGVEEWFAARDVLAGRVGAAQEQLDAARRATAVPLPRSNQALRAWWDAKDTTLEQRRALLDRMLVAVIVKPATQRGRPTLDPDRVVPRWRN
jgi:DNA invertase Pin-like site-specific DNA recombinase